MNPVRFPESSDTHILHDLQRQLEGGEGEDRIAALHSIAKVLFRKQRYSEAVAVYELLLDADSSNASIQEALGRCLERMGRWGEAVARYQLALQANPERVDSLVGLGLCMLRQDAPLAALNAFDRCLSIKPGHAGALLGKATCLRLVGRIPEADTVYREVLRMQPGIKAELGALLGSPAESLEPAAAADPPPPAPEESEHPVSRLSFPVSEGPPAPLPHLSRDIAELEDIIETAVMAEDYQTAAQHCRTLTELAPDYFEAWFNLGVFEQRNENLDLAIEAFQAAAREDPSRIEPLQALAQAHHQKGDLPAAEHSYRAALALTPDSPQLLWNLGLVCEQRGNFEAAEQNYSRLVKGDQDWGEAWFRLGLVRLHLRKYDLSVVAFRRALILGSRAFEANYNLGLAYWELGRLNLADRSFRSALRMQPDSTLVPRALAAVAVKEEDDARARDLHRELVERGDSSVEIVFNLAVFAHRANRLQSAIEFYKQALKIHPDLEEATAGLALAQSALSARRFQ